jgi:hypothetical protein
MKRHNIVLARDDGGVEVHPMKEWLRQHPEHIPTGLDPTTSTSHQLRSALKRVGWTMEELDDEVRLISPDDPDLKGRADVLLGDDTESDTGEFGDAAFALEAQLRDFLAQNLQATPIAGRRLRLYVDPSGRDGIEYPTGVGPIDILAVDDRSNFVVFELKLARSPDRAVGQLTRYMGWVRQTIGKDRDVFGVIVAKSIDEKLRYAASVIPNVALLEYEVEFHLRQVSIESTHAG